MLQYQSVNPSEASGFHPYMRRVIQCRLHSLHSRLALPVLAWLPVAITDPLPVSASRMLFPGPGNLAFLPATAILSKVTVIRPTCSVRWSMTSPSHPGGAASSANPFGNNAFVLAMP